MYDKVGNKVKQATAHCPYCLNTNIVMLVSFSFRRYAGMVCRHCGWRGDYEELAFMKLRSKRPVPMRNNNPNYYMNKKTKYGGKSDLISDRP